MTRVAVVGAGVIGLSCAYQLAKRGVSVTLIERAAPGGACSAGNLGWIVPSLSEPLPAPGLVGQSVKWMLKKDSPLYISPRFAFDSMGWLWKFWRHCNPRDYHHGLEATAALNRRTLELYDALASDGVRFEMHRKGLLFLFMSEAPLERAYAEFQALAEMGLATPRRLDRDEVVAMEPGLAVAVHGGVLVEGERYVRPETVSAGLLDRFRSLGGTLLRAEVLKGQRRRGRVTLLSTNHGQMEADAVVLAAGSWSGPLAERLGFRLPIRPGKGYSVTVSTPEGAPSRAMYLNEMRVGITPFNGAARLGGTMELSGFNTTVVKERVNAIRRAAARYFPQATRGSASVEWTGMRPLTPDGLPAIGRAPGFENVYVATGHAMLGMTLAPVTGVAIAELVTGATPSFDLEPFDPGRF